MACEVLNSAPRPGHHLHGLAIQPPRHCQVGKCLELLNVGVQVILSEEGRGLPGVTVAQVDVAVL